MDQGAAALLDFNRKRKEGSRERLLAAAAAAFCERGFLEVSAEDIASAAAVSRMTLYRHFGGKGEIAEALFRQSVAEARPLLVAIARLDHRDRNTVRSWIESIFASDRRHRQLLWVFFQANAAHPGFTDVGHEFIDGLVADLGKAIPAFAVTRDGSCRRYAEAWLLLYELLDQSNHAARGRSIADEATIVEVVTDRFLRFVTG